MDVNRLPTKKVNILDFLKPEPKSRRAVALDSEPQEHPTFHTGPQDSVDSAGRSSNETEQHIANNDPMDESTGLDLQQDFALKKHNQDYIAHQLPIGAEQTGSENLTMALTPPKGSADINRDGITLLQLDNPSPMDSAPLPPSDHLTHQADGAQSTFFSC